MMVSSLEKLTGLFSRRKSNQNTSYRTNFPDFWHSFVRYVTNTQIVPGTIEDLKHRFHDTPEISRQLTEMQEQGQDISAVLEHCIRELEGRFIPRDDNKNYSLVSGKQLPRVELPSGGDYDIPLHCLLERYNSESNAMRWYNVLKMHVSSKDPGVFVNVGGTIPAVLQGGSNSKDNILTVGGAKEFIGIYGLYLPWIHRLGEKGYNAIITALNSVKSPN